MENQKAIHVFATWKVKEGEIATVLNILQSVQKESIKERGNLFYNIHQNIADPNTLILYEGYINEEAVTEHRNSSYFQELVLGKIVPLLETREIILSAIIE
ncbi:MAG: antibiotic biosynthesis monooxygenase [Flavobacterium sp.]|nr:MAG: antibiotic biosynthesis monooxygenase [Flavobacterium sp.]